MTGENHWQPAMLSNAAQDVFLMANSSLWNNVAFNPR